MIAGKILLLFGQKFCEQDYVLSRETCTVEKALDNLIGVFNISFIKNIMGKKILDFGCGYGYQAVALALKGAEYVVGVDKREELLTIGNDLAKDYGVSEKVVFKKFLTDDYLEFFDVIISHNSFEHYEEPHRIINLWTKVLKRNGLVYITFGPPWYAPYGAHMQFFTKVPWVNLFFTEKTILNIRSKFICDGAKKYEEVTGGLNKMSLRKFEKIIRESKLKVNLIKYDAVKKLNFLTKIPFLKEFFTNRVSCILNK